MNRITAVVLSVFLLTTGLAAAETAPVDVGNKFCPVSGEAVDESTGMEPVTYEHNGKIYHLCCPSCIPDFKKDPEKYSKIAEEEVANQKNAF